MGGGPSAGDSGVLDFVVALIGVGFALYHMSYIFALLLALWSFVMDPAGWMIAAIAAGTAGMVWWSVNDGPIRQNGGSYTDDL